MNYIRHTEECIKHIRIFLKNEYQEKLNYHSCMHTPQTRNRTLSILVIYWVTLLNRIPFLPRRGYHLFKCCVNHSQALKFFGPQYYIVKFELHINEITLYVLFSCLFFSSTFSTFIYIDMYSYNSFIFIVLYYSLCKYTKIYLAIIC